MITCRAIKIWCLRLGFAPGSSCVGFPPRKKDIWVPSLRRSELLTPPPSLVGIWDAVCEPQCAPVIITVNSWIYETSYIHLVFGVLVAGLNKHDSFTSSYCNSSPKVVILRMTPGMIQEPFARPKLINHTKRIACVWWVAHSTPTLAAGITLSMLQHRSLRFRLPLCKPYSEEGVH